MYSLQTYVRAYIVVFEDFLPEKKAVERRVARIAAARDDGPPETKYCLRRFREASVTFDDFQPSYLRVWRKRVFFSKSGR